MAEPAEDGARADVLALLRGERRERVPCFSGLNSASAPGLESLGLRFDEIHTDPAKMALAAESSFRAFGWQSVVVPMDMCVEASALGAEIDFRHGAPRPEFPRPAAPLAASAEDFPKKLPGQITTRGRLPVVLEAIRRLKNSAGQDVAVGAWLPGPLTLAMQVVDIQSLMAGLARKSEAVDRLLDPLTDLLVEVGQAYHDAGADYLTIHEMGGSPGFIGPPSFKRLVQPRLIRLLAALPAPLVLSVCGDTNAAMRLLAECGADALSVDQLNDVARSRQTLGPGALLFGNIDPIGVLANGDEAGVRAAARRALEGGIDAVWPGCDLWPDVPAQNLLALADETRRYRRGR